MINKYGKSSASLMTLKRDFIVNNDHHFNRLKEMNQLYAQQEARVKCKNCNSFLVNKSFHKLGVDYTVCDQCGHLNGCHEDSSEFCSAVYSQNKGSDYASNYESSTLKDYDKRVNDIYIPKAEFMRDSLLEMNEKVCELRYSDIGAGSGYYVKALLECGMTNVNGYDVSGSQVDLGNTMIGDHVLVHHTLDDVISIVGTVNSDVVSLIGVLEHLQNPRQILRALKNNPKVRYLYISVPLFSPTVYFEMVFQNVMHRQLSGGHTHLYTQSSLEWLCKEFGLEQVAAWWFGTDVFDLFRNVSVQLQMNPGTVNMIDEWKKMFVPIIDAMQNEIDKKHLSSEVHMLLKFI